VSTKDPSSNDQQRSIIILSTALHHYPLFCFNFANMWSHSPDSEIVYDVVNYTNYQAGEDIRDEDVVRPCNHRYSINGSVERWTWALKNRSSTLTYGSCTKCFKAGPNGQVCLDHDGDHSHGFMMLAIEGNEFNSGQWIPTRLIDSLTLAEMFGLGVQVCKGHKLQHPRMQRTKEFDLCVYYDLVRRHTVENNMTSEERSGYQEHMRKLYCQVFDDNELYRAASERSRRGLHLRF
jgi:hypothetical protein